MLPVAANVVVLGLKISALATAFPLSSIPQVTRTFPFFSSVDVCNRRAAVILTLVWANVPVFGSNRSASFKLPEEPTPPAMRTFPSPSKVAV
jgi:hypothetical protein